MAQLDIFCYLYRATKAEIHIRLQDFASPSLMVASVNGEEVARVTDNITNGITRLTLSGLEYGTTYNVNVTVEDSSVSYQATGTITTPNIKTIDNNGTAFKDFYIGVANPGAYTKSATYQWFGVKREFGIMVKHTPYSLMPKIKNVVVQSWLDEDGDDVWLPQVQDSLSGVYKPAVTHEATELTVTFVAYFTKDKDGNKMDANTQIRRFIERIEGRWLQVWDDYTRIGFDGVYLVDVDDDPEFKRRNYDYVKFDLKFKVNGRNITEKPKEI